MKLVAAAVNKNNVTVSAVKRSDSPGSIMIYVKDEIMCRLCNMEKIGFEFDEESARQLVSDIQGSIAWLHIGEPASVEKPKEE